MSIKKIVSVVLFLIAVVLIVSGFYILNSNKYIFEIVLSKSLDMAVDGMYTNNFMLDDLADSDKYMINTNTSLKSSNEEMVALKGNMYMTNDKLYLDLNSRVMEQDFIKLESLIDSDNIYFKLKDAIDKFYYMELDSVIGEIEEDNYSSIGDLEKDDIKVLTNHLKKSILQNLKNEDFEKNSETLTLDGKSYKTNRLSLNLSEAELRQIIINLYENIINDNKAIQVLQKFDNSITANDIKESLEIFKEESVDASEDDALNVAFYISGISDVIRVELLTLNNAVDSVATDNLIVTIDMYKNSSNNEVSRLIIKSNNMELFNIKETKISDTKTNLEIIVNDGYEVVTIIGEHTKTAMSIILDLNLSLNNEEVGSLNYSISQVTKNQEYKLKLDVTINENEMVLNSTNSIFLNENIPTVDTNGAENIDNISEEDEEQLMTYIYEKLSEVGLDEYLTGVDSEDDYDDKNNIE